MTEKVDLNQLRERLAKLGVQIDIAAEPSTLKSDGARPPAAWQASAVPWETNLYRSSKEVAQLLERCNKVHQALNKPAGSSEEEQPAKQTNAKENASKAAVAVAAAAAAVRANGIAAASECQPQLAAGRPPPKCSSSSTVSANAAVAAAAVAAKSSPAKDSKLLVRAAQRLLRSAPAAAELVDRALTVAPVQPAAQPAAVAAKGSNAGADRGSPLGTVLAQYKEAQASWAQEKAKLRREAVTNRKKASKLELDMAKLQRMHEHKTLDVSSLRAALKGRDLQLDEAHTRIKQLEEALAKSQEVAAEKLCNLAAERDDLQALLLATLQRLEGVEAVVAAADATSAAMEDKVRVLEGERQAALELAHAAKAELTHLKEEQRRLQWQSQLLEKMSEVQLRHNKRKSAAIKELLSTTAADEPGGSTAAAGGKHNHSRSSTKQHRSPGNPSAVLQDLLDELLENNDANEAAELPSGAAGRCGFEDDSTSEC